ncbi:hypothetical protein SAMN04515678_106198 [Roseivivax sediminis]|uniref:CbbX AAA lid domain-containing protein n=1 Tax=Roseivivax sediminis TaxID=936889 RepID=A0A1I1XXX0_9RHOB|nr:hypothetical protein SAMN04515678_106198 [Roseivivax sediminis]
MNEALKSPTVTARSAPGDGALRRAQPHFANARSILNAIDRMRLRQANRLFESVGGRVGIEAVSTIEESDVRASRVFRGGLDSDVAPEDGGKEDDR